VYLNVKHHKSVLSLSTLAYYFNIYSF